MDFSSRVRKATSALPLFLMAGLWLDGSTQGAAHSNAASAGTPASPPKMVQFVRDRFEVPEGVRLTAEPLRKSAFPSFYETVITSEDGKEKRSNVVFITKDGRCFVAGNVFALTVGSSDEIIRCVREAARIPSATKLTLTPFQQAAYAGFLKSTITAWDGRTSQTGEVFITGDRRTGVLGIILPFAEDYVERMIVTKDQPTAGSPSAPVTIVEYADLQCPGCARFHHFLEDELLPEYGKKVRLVFKELPLSIHDWASTAAIANECVYQIEPSAFLGFRTLVFSNQGTISATNVRQTMLSLGEQLRIDRLSLGACIDAKASRERVEAMKKEAENLRISKTPTCFVNGRIVIGTPPAETFKKIVDEALASHERNGKATTHLPH